MDNIYRDKTNRIDVLKIIMFGIVGLLHVSFIFLIINGIRYINLSKITIMLVICIIICLLTIIDIIVIYSISTNQLSFKIVISSISFILLIVTGIASFYVIEINSNVNKIVDSIDEVQYETIRGVVVTYDNEKIKDINDLSGKTVGTLNTTGISAAAIGKQKLTDSKIEVKYEEYETTADLFTALVEGKVDAAIFSNVFKTQLSGDDETYEEFFEKTNTIYEYEEKIQTNNYELSKKDLSSEPFTILLMGYAPEAGGGGLTDTIILAAVNPNTMSVTMTSIARDSYVPIACYGNRRSKINDAGAASNACLIDTVEQLTGIDIDFYMRVNFQGVVDIVDAIGGVNINSPVEFTGQSSSSSRGKYNVWVPAGEYIATGEQALAFARERHAMPGGDFDRQINQQNLIKHIAQKIISMNDVNQALKVLEAAGDNLSTNMTVSQITSVLNYILNAKNYSGQSQFKIIDMKMSRLTGYTYWFYSYSMRLPLWSYYLYQGSIDENVKLLKETLGIFDEINQWDKMNIFVNMPYVREPVYNEYFNEKHVPEDMPPMYPSLIGYTYEQALAWANENGISINWVTIDEGTPEFNESQLGTVVAQDPRKGALIEENPSCTLTVMGSLVPAQNRIPNFVGKTLSEAINWCNNNGVSYSTTELPNADNSKSLIISEQSVSPGKDKTKIDKIVFTYYQKVVKQITAESLAALIGHSKDEVITFCTNNGIISYSFSIDPAASGSCGAITSVSPTSGTSDTVYVFYQAPHNYVEDPSLETNSTCTVQGKKVYKCSVCGDIKEDLKPLIDHTYVEDPGQAVPSTCTTQGKKVFKCSVCGSTMDEPQALLDHTWGAWTDNGDGTQTRECGVCGATETNPIS